MTDNNDNTVGFAFDQRGVSEVIGSILVFGLLVSLMAIVQAQGIPNANEEVEFQHSQQVRSDFASVQAAIDNTMESGRSHEAAVDLGVSYPSRLLFYNPPSAQGRLSTVENPEITIENVESDSSASVYLNHVSSVNVSTKTLEYDVDYNQIDREYHLRREPGVHYAQEGNGTIVRSTTLVDDKSITLVAIGGNLSAGSVTRETIEAKALSTPKQSYVVSDEGSDNLTIKVPTRLSESKWREILADELAPSGYIANLSVETVTGSEYDHLRLEFEPGEQYELRMGKVGFGSGGETDPAYIVPVKGNTGKATVEVRDKFNNPKSGVTLNVDFPTASSTTVTTGPNGRASVHRPASGDAYANFSADFAPGSNSYEQAQAFFGNDIVLTDATGYPINRFDITVQNPGEPRKITSVHVHHLTSYDGGIAVRPTLKATAVNDGPNSVTLLSVAGTSSGFVSDAPIENGPPEPLQSTLTLPHGSGQTLRFSLDEVYEFATNSDALTARVTIHFEDGGEKTFDVELRGIDDA